MTHASSTSIAEQNELGFSIYSTSDSSEEMFYWIQPSISRQVYDPGTSSIISGIYVRSRMADYALLVEPELAREFEAWEAASDEALMLFESESN